MNQAKCSCAQFDRLEGASVPAYIKAFLEESRGPTSVENNRYRCRVCRRVWERREPAEKSEGTRPSLVRLMTAMSFVCSLSAIFN
ncbi:MAG: hypothetical protein ICV68_00365 [Pyrinomonadaceae bacterium]|nr:hypothetical protein [Pyrinomonadaceae bacterium]